MATEIQHVRVQNFRALADVSLDLGSTTVLFGQNGAGKSTLLDALSFVRDCAVRSVDLAASVRGLGVGMLFDGAPAGAAIVISVTAGADVYELRIGVSSGRIDPLPGERFSTRGAVIFDRAIGSDRATVVNARHLDATTILREPKELFLKRLADAETGVAAEILGSLLRIRQYQARRFDFERLKTRGSDSGTGAALQECGQDLWSVLRNVQGKNAVDDRYRTIVAYMREAFPSSFDDLVLEQTGPSTVYGSFVEKGRRNPILASGVSDGQLQLLILLTALFSEGRNFPAILLFDEPDLSLHPWALAVLARAIRDAAANWQKRIVLATHSPVLLSQFEPSEIVECDAPGGRTRFRRLSDVKEVQDLLAEYSVGSLYMSQAIAPQQSDATANGVHPGTPGGG